MTDYLFTASTADWTLTADTTAPAGEPPPARVLLAGLTASWAVDVIPPVTVPATAQFQVYDRGDDPAGWLPLAKGMPIRLVLRPYPSLTRLVNFNGRISDLSAVNHKDGGVIFTVICADPTADLAGVGSPRLLPAALAFDPVSGIEVAYDRLADRGEFTLDITDSISVPAPGSPDFDQQLHPIHYPLHEYDAGGQSILDVLGMYVQHDTRDHADGRSLRVGRWLAPALDSPTATTPQAARKFVLCPYDPLDSLGLAGVLELVWTGSKWTVQPVNDFYGAGGTGLVLSASQLLADVGEWRNSAPDQVNAVEVTSTDTFEDFVGTALRETVRSRFAAAVSAYGANTRSLSSPHVFTENAVESLADVILGYPGELTPDGYGLSRATVVWDQLSAAQIGAWGDQLWPYNRVKAPARPLAIVDIPAHWRLASQAVTGRLVGVTVTADGRRILAELAIRPAAPLPPAGAITYTQLAARSPAPTYANFDPNVSIDQLALVAGP